MGVPSTPLIVWMMGLLRGSTPKATAGTRVGERIEAADAAGEPIVPVTLAEELATNPFLRATQPSVKASVGLAGADDAAVFAEVRRRKDAF